MDLFQKTGRKSEFIWQKNYKKLAVFLEELLNTPAQKTLRDPKDPPLPLPKGGVLQRGRGLRQINAQQLPSHLRGGAGGGVCVIPKRGKMLTPPLHPSETHPCPSSREGTGCAERRQQCPSVIVRGKK